MNQTGKSARIVSVHMKSGIQAINSLDVHIMKTHITWNAMVENCMVAL